MNDQITDPHKSLSKIINILTGFGFNQIFSNSLQSSRKISALKFNAFVAQGGVPVQSVRSFAPCL